ncbi:MAG: dUTP diphosphatase [Alphaproteobacteria bacterium]|nr:dUTP diphosphatase [Rickettsiales bacterium]
MKIQFTSGFANKVYKGGKLLKYETNGSSGIDLRSISILEQGEKSRKWLLRQDEDKALINTEGEENPVFIKEYILNPNARALVFSGICASIEKGTEIQIRARSGLSWKNGVTILNSPATIDSDYRGEIGSMVINSSKEPFTITAGLRVSQIVVAPIIVAQIEYTDQLDQTDRGESGFGSTGIL